MRQKFAQQRYISSDFAVVDMLHEANSIVSYQEWVGGGDVAFVPLPGSAFDSDRVE